MKLTELMRGQRATIEHIAADAPLARKLLEMGLMEGMELRLAHVAPFGHDPIAIEISDRCIALRRCDAANITIRPLP